MRKARTPPDNLVPQVAEMGVFRNLAASPDLWVTLRLVLLGSLCR